MTPSLLHPLASPPPEAETGCHSSPAALIRRGAEVHAVPTCCRSPHLLVTLYRKQTPAPAAAYLSAGFSVVSRARIYEGQSEGGR